MLYLVIVTTIITYRELVKNSKKKQIILKKTFNKVQKLAELCIVKMMKINAVYCGFRGH